MSFPSITDQDLSLEKNKGLVKQALDFAVANFQAKSSERRELQELYDSYNGYVSKSRIQSIIRRHGKASKTKYINYHIGRNKMKQVHGEFLQIGFDPTVHTINRDASNRKMEKYKNLLGLAYSKPEIEKIRSQGFNVFPGVEFPDLNDKSIWSVNNFKLANEEILQHFISDKRLTQEIVSIFYNNWIDLTITSGVFGKVERDMNGIDTYRFIPFPLAIFLEDINDPYLKRSPYIGEMRPMYLHDILTSSEFDLSPSDVTKIKGLFEDQQSIGNSNDDYFTVTETGRAINTYTVQVKGVVPYHVKVEKDKNGGEPYKMPFSVEYFNANEAKIRKDVKNGKYELITRYREVVWTLVRIGQDIYLKPTKNTKLIQVLNKNGKYNVEYDYCGMLFNTVNGKRVSLQSLISEYENLYNDLRYYINKEIRKIKGNFTVIDEAFKDPKKQVRDLVYDIDEDGIMTINTAAEGNKYGMEGDNNSGVRSNTIPINNDLQILLLIAQDIERVMDKVTGMNDDRQGIGKASQTATTNMNNIEASRSMTYDMFFFMNIYMKDVMRKLVEKAKFNFVNDKQDNRDFLFDDQQLSYLEITKDIITDNYMVALTDGKKENDVLSKVEMLFPQEINAGNIRSKDIARFFMSSSYSQAIKVLDNAASEINAIREREQKLNSESQERQQQMQIQAMTEDREDRQRHEEDLEVLKNEGKKEQIQLQKSFDGMIKNQAGLGKVPM